MDLKANVFLCGLLLCGSALAHHSRSIYDMDTFLEYEGTVVEFAWSNPHAFIVIDFLDEARQPIQLLLELLGSKDFTGIWNRARLTDVARNNSSRFGPADLPVTAEGPSVPVRGAYVLRNNIELSDWSCDPDIAVRHLTGE